MDAEWVGRRAARAVNRVFVHGDRERDARRETERGGRVKYRRHRSSTVMCVVMCDAAISDVIQSPSAFPLPKLR